MPSDRKDSSDEAQQEPDEKSFKRTKPAENGEHKDEDAIACVVARVGVEHDCQHDREHPPERAHQERDCSNPADEECQYGTDCGCGQAAKKDDDAPN
jgi:hypothetical protein